MAINESEASIKTLFITGGSGFLGWNLVKSLKDTHRVYASYHTYPIRAERCTALKLNICDRSAVRETLEAIKPDVIFHTAALAKVDLCEKNKELAYQINVEGTKNLVVESPKHSRFIYISTDLVFNGRQSFYRETDPPDPLNFYGETKLLGETVTAQNAANYLVIRTSLMYGYGNDFNEGFLGWLRKSLNQRAKVKLFVDQYRTPLLVSEAVKALGEVAMAPARGEVFHLAGSERINRYEFGRKFTRIFGYPEDLLEPATMEQVLTARMPADCSLHIHKIQGFLSFRLSNVERGLKKLRTL